MMVKKALLTALLLLLCLGAACSLEGEAAAADVPAGTVVEVYRSPT